MIRAGLHMDKARQAKKAAGNIKDIEQVKVPRKDVIAQAGESRTTLISASKNASMASAAA